MTFLECVERRKRSFIGYIIGYIVGYGIMEFFGFPATPITGLNFFGLAAGILLAAPAWEYYGQDDEKQESLS